MILTLAGLMATQYLNAPYKWGANGPFEFDCSGLVLKVMHDVGVTLPDMTAQHIYNWATDEKELESCEPDSDCLLFFGRDNKNISHVALAIDDKYMIEAGGAGRESLRYNMSDLSRLDARVRIKPITNRGDLVASIKIKY